MRKAKSIFQGKNEPVWVRPSDRSTPNKHHLCHAIFINLMMTLISGTAPIG